MQAVSAGAARAWSAPQIDGRLAAGRHGARAASELDEAAQRVWREAEEAGRAEGIAAGQRQIAQQMQALEAQGAALQAMIQALARPLADVDDEVHAQIAQLAIAVARGLLRRELRTDPAQVIGIVRDTVALLPASARGVRVVLHPDDASLVRERLAAPHSGEAWSIAEDPVLSRGDCRVIAEYAEIDARLENRLAAALASLVGEERQTPRGGEQ